MWSARLASVVFPVSAAMLLGVARGHEPGSQNHPARPAYDASAHGIVREIRVDERCRILPDPGEEAKVKPRLRRDADICHLESVMSSSHTEERIAGGWAQRSLVDIAEQGYVLQDVTEDPVVFLVEEQVPKGWSVDSDPQPKAFDGATAIFRVNAVPGEIVRLHVGLRHARPLKPKRVAAGNSR